MAHRIELEKWMKIGLFVIGIVHLCIGLISAKQAFTELSIETDLSQKEDIINVYDIESTMMIPSVPPYFVFVVLIFFIKLQIYMLSYLVMVSQVLEITLFVVALFDMRRIYDTYETHFDNVDSLEQLHGNVDVTQLFSELNSVYELNLKIIIVTFIVCITTIGVCFSLAIHYCPARRNTQNDETDEEQEQENKKKEELHREKTLEEQREREQKEMEKGKENGKDLIL